MSRRDAVAAVVARLGTIENIGTIYDCLANPNTDRSKKDRYAPKGEYRTWEVTCEASDGADTETATARTYTVVAYGYFSYVNDGSKEADAQGICQAIEAEFDPVSGRTFDGKFSTSEPVAVDGPKAFSFGGVLVYLMIATFRITEFPIY